MPIISSPRSPPAPTPDSPAAETRRKGTRARAPHRRRDGLSAAVGTDAMIGRRHLPIGSYRVVSPSGCVVRAEPEEPSDVLQTLRCGETVDAFESVGAPPGAHWLRIWAKRKRQNGWSMVLVGWATAHAPDGTPILTLARRLAADGPDKSAERLLVSSARCRSEYKRKLESTQVLLKKLEIYNRHLQIGKLTLTPEHEDRTTRRAEIDRDLLELEETLSMMLETASGMAMATYRVVSKDGCLVREKAEHTSGPLHTLLCGETFDAYDMLRLPFSGVERVFVSRLESSGRRWKGCAMVLEGWVSAISTDGKQLLEMIPNNYVGTDSLAGSWPHVDCPQHLDAAESLVTQLQQENEHLRNELLALMLERGEGCDSMRPAHEAAEFTFSVGTGNRNMRDKQLEMLATEEPEMERVVLHENRRDRARGQTELSAHRTTADTPLQSPCPVDSALITKKIPTWTEVPHTVGLLSAAERGSSKSQDEVEIGRQPSRDLLLHSSLRRSTATSPPWIAFEQTNGGSAEESQLRTVILDQQAEMAATAERLIASEASVQRLERIQAAMEEALDVQAAAHAADKAATLHSHRAAMAAAVDSHRAEKAAWQKDADASVATKVSKAVEALRRGEQAMLTEERAKTAAIADRLAATEAALERQEQRKASVALAFSALQKLMSRVDAAQIFERFDTDGDGLVSKAELHEGFRAIGEDLDEATMDEVMAFVDADGDGSIDASEFLRLSKMKDDLERIEAANASAAAERDAATRALEVQAAAHEAAMAAAVDSHRAEKAAWQKDADASVATKVSKAVEALRQGEQAMLTEERAKTAAIADRLAATEAALERQEQRKASVALAFSALQKLMSRVDAAQIFERFDTDGDGLVSKAELHEGFRAIGEDLDEATMDEVMAFVGADGDGSLDASEFLRLSKMKDDLERIEAANASAAAERDAATRALEVQAAAHEAAMAAAVDSHRAEKAAWQKDADASVATKVSKAVEALRQGEQAMLTEERAKTAAIADRLAATEAALERQEQRKASVALAFSALQKLMSRVDAAQIFERFDTDGDGLVSKAELHEGFRAIGEDLDEATMDEVMAFVDADGDGSIDASEFLRLSKMKDDLERIEAANASAAAERDAATRALEVQAAAHEAAMAAAVDSHRAEKAAWQKDADASVAAKVSKAVEALRQGEQAMLTEERAKTAAIADRLAATEAALERQEQRKASVALAFSALQKLMSRVDAAQIFERFDTDGDGLVSKAELHEGFRAIGEDLDEATMDEVMAFVDADGDGSIDASEFLRLSKMKDDLERIEAANASAAAERDAATRALEVQAAAHEAAMAAAVDSHRAEKAAWQKDADASVATKVSKAVEALRQGEQAMLTEERAKTAAIADRLAATEAALERQEQRKASVALAFSALQKLMSRVDAAQIFERFDTDGDGLVSKAELHEGFRAIGEDLDEATMDEVMAFVDADGDGSIDASEFLRLSKMKDDLERIEAANASAAAERDAATRALEVQAAAHEAAMAAAVDSHRAEKAAWQKDADASVATKVSKAVEALRQGEQAMLTEERAKTAAIADRLAATEAALERQEQRKASVALAFSALQKLMSRVDAAQIFERFDTDGDGLVSKAELHEGFRAIGEDLDEATMDEVMAFVDADGDGSIDASEFLRLSKMKDEHEAAMAAVLDSHQAETALLLHDQAERKAAIALAFSALQMLMAHPDVAQIFEQFDTDGDGRITKAELQAGFRLIGERLDEAAMDEVMAFIDADGCGYIRTSEFLRLRTMKNELEKIEAQARGLPPFNGVHLAMSLDWLEQQASASAALAAALKTVRRTKLSRNPTAAEQRTSVVEQQREPGAQICASIDQRHAPVKKGDDVQMIADLFERFDSDDDGFHNLKESQSLALFVHDHVLRRGEFLDLCADLDADAKLGISLQQFTTIYTDPEFHADLQGDYKKVFGARLIFPRSRTNSEPK